MPLPVQTASNSLFGSSTIATAFLSPNTGGNTLIAVVGYRNSVFGVGGTLTMTDSQGNSWTLIQHLTDGVPHLDVSVWIATDCAAGANSVTYNDSVAAHSTVGLCMAIAEYGGLGSSPSVVSHNQLFDSTTTTPISLSLTNQAGDTLTISDETVPTANYTVFGAIDVYGNGNEILVFYEGGPGIHDARTVTVSPSGTLTLEQDPGGPTTGNVDFSNQGNVHYWDLGTASAPPPVFGISCGSPPDGTIGTPYDFTGFPVSNGTPPYTFQVCAGSLPPGLTLNPLTGEVTGTPTTAGTFCFTICVAEGAPNGGGGGGSGGGGGDGGGGSTGLSFNFVNQVSAAFAYGSIVNSQSLSPGVWDTSGNIIKYETFQLPDGIDARLTFELPQSGTLILTPGTYQNGFVNQTSVPITHNLGTFNIIPVVFDPTFSTFEFRSFVLTSANSAVMTFDVAQSGNVVLISSAKSYSQDFTSTGSGDPITVTHNLNAPLVRVAVYDSLNNLIDFDNCQSTDPNTAIVSFVTAQSGRIVVIVP